MPGEFECNDGTCIERERLCDGFRDCSEGDDEDPQNCPYLPESETDDEGLNGPEYEYEATTSQDTHIAEPTEINTENPIYFETTTVFCKFFFFIACVQIETSVSMKLRRLGFSKYLSRVFLYVCSFATAVLCQLNMHCRSIFTAIFFHHPITFYALFLNCAYLHFSHTMDSAAVIY